MTDQELLPIRNIAEHAYCPRLFYFVQVEGIMVPSEDTEQGRAVHTRVNRPSSARADKAGSDDRDPDEPVRVRTLALSSETMGITGVLDLAEISGRAAVPVEYRKGRPRKTSSSLDIPNGADGQDIVEPWPSDRIQVALQAMLLEEGGYTVEHAIIYYASEKRRLKVVVDHTLREEALAAIAAARLTHQGTRPLPLLNDPRCVRCSLQPHCLPDEIRLQRATERTEELTPRKIWPPRDEGFHVVVQTSPARIGIRGGELRVSDDQGKSVKEVPLANVESISILGYGQLSTQALHALAERRIPTAFLSSAGRLIGLMDPLDSVSAVIRRCQVLEFEKPERVLALVRALIIAKISNQRTLLMRNHASLPADVGKHLAGLMRHVSAADSLEAIRGYEGQAAATYFRHFAGVFRGSMAEEFSANGRKRRPPPDPINSCLSMAYTMLAHECVAALRLARLEPSIGAFHVSRPGRPAMALDLMEPFRPLIGDSVAVTLFNRGELREGHFSRTSAGCMLTDAGRKAFFNAYGRRMNTDVTHPVFDYRLCYRRMLVLHARMIAAWLVGEIPDLSFLTTR